MIPEKLNILEAADRQVTAEFDPHIVGDVNDYQVKVAKFGETFGWHSHPEEDEAFLVLRGRIALDFRAGTVDLDDGDFIVVPRGVEHRPRSLTDQPIVLMFEPGSTRNTGDRINDLTIDVLKRLKPV